MISLKHIVESQAVESQFYDLGRDFSNFSRTIDGTTEEIKSKFEQSIGSKLIGKRVRARASRGYKQYVKDYEFDVTRITLDDYYDNYVVVAYDNATPKPKEYFLKPGFKIQILGPATGQPSPQKGNKPEGNASVPKQPVTPQTNPDMAQSHPMSPAVPGHSETPVKENEEAYEAYSIEQIEKDIKPWLPSLLLKPESALRDFIKRMGWMMDNTALFDIIIPINALKTKISPEIIQKLLLRCNDEKNNFSLKSMKKNDANDEWLIRIKKTINI